MNNNVNKCEINSLIVGMSESSSHLITDSDIIQFANLSGDKNPIHISEEYAKNSRFKKRIAHGMLSASFFSALFGTKLPGYGCVYVSQSLFFRRPVYLGDVVTARIEIIEVNVSKSRVKFLTTCKVREKIVVDGNAELFVP